MPTTWIEALTAYRYPVDLSRYQNAHHHPGWFTHDLSIGNRTQTMGFEEHFRNHAAHRIEPWLEVVFWKLFSQPRVSNRTTERVEEKFQGNGITAESLWAACTAYIQSPSRDRFETFRKIVGFATPVIAVVATFPAFVNPGAYPMVDKRIAKWVGACMLEHNAADPGGPQLTSPPFLDKRDTVLMMNDFDFMQVWRRWCNHNAHKLRVRTPINWRARDVEMAVFYAWGDRYNNHPSIHLTPLPPV